MLSEPPLAVSFEVGQLFDVAVRQTNAVLRVLHVEGGREGGRVRWARG